MTAPAALRAAMVEKMARAIWEASPLNHVGDQGEHQAITWAELSGIYPHQRRICFAKAEAALAAQEYLLQDRLDDATDRLQRIVQWCDAYPVDIFTPNREDANELAAKILAPHGISLSAMHAEWARHILGGIRKIADLARSDADGG